MANPILGAFTSVRTTTIEFDKDSTVFEFNIPANSIILTGGGVNVGEAFTAGTLDLADDSGQAIGGQIDLTSAKLTAISGLTNPTDTDLKIVGTVAGADTATAGKGTIAIVYAHLSEVSGAYFGQNG
jgi:hypothetical protein